MYGPTRYVLPKSPLLADGKGGSIVARFSWDDSQVSQPRTLTIPDATGTVALLERANTWTAAQTISSTTASTSTTTGALTVAGGVGVAGASFFGGLLTVANTSSYSFTGAGTQTITGAVANGFLNAIRLAPTYSGAFTVTRHHYQRFENPVLSGGAALTDAFLAFYDADPGTHKAIDAGTTKTSPGTVSAWEKVNVNGTTYYRPLYTSKTT